VEEEMELQMVPARGVATQDGARVADGSRAPAKDVLRRRLEAVVAMAAMCMQVWLEEMSGVRAWRG
jgi:hypothetical protein